MVRCKAADWPNLMAWVFETKNYDILKKDIAPTFAKAVLKETGELPPACEFTTLIKTSFTRDKKSGSSTEPADNV